jgi:hypothetical protein
MDTRIKAVLIDDDRIAVGLIDGKSLFHWCGIQDWRIQPKNSVPTGRLLVVATVFIGRILMKTSVQTDCCVVFLRLRRVLRLAHEHTSSKLALNMLLKSGNPEIFNWPRF